VHISSAEKAHGSAAHTPKTLLPSASFFLIEVAVFIICLY
jgi:hypothetical protein